MKLKPCPFCGRVRIIIVTNENTGISLRSGKCTRPGCGIYGPYRMLVKAAEVAWNRRAGEKK
jgi:hypothetical protein